MPSNTETARTKRFIGRIICVRDRQVYEDAELARKNLEIRLFVLASGDMTGMENPVSMGSSGLCRSTFFYQAEENLFFSILAQFFLHKTVDCWSCNRFTLPQ